MESDGSLMVVCHPPTATAKPARATDDGDRELFVCPFSVLVDTREQAPWQFNGIAIERRQWVIPRKVVTLQTGDYSIQGHEDRLCIERKSGDDLVGSITAGNARFRREHERMQAMLRDQEGNQPFACVIVEASLSAICDELDADDGRRVTSESIMGAVASWPQRYGVHWLFAGDRRTAEKLAFRVILKFWKEHGDGQD